MLGEGLTTAAPVQFAKFDESSFDRPRRRRPIVVAGLLVAALFLFGALTALG